MGQIEERIEDTLSRDWAVRVVLDMANRYDEDIEGCDGYELIRYTEAISCCFRLAFALKYSHFQSDGEEDKAKKLTKIAKQLYKEPLQWHT